MIGMNAETSRLETERVNVFLFFILLGTDTSKVKCGNSYGLKLLVSDHVIRYSDTLMPI